MGCRAVFVHSLFVGISRLLWPVHCTWRHRSWMLAWSALLPLMLRLIVCFMGL
jgi:hypothetical protein